MSKKIVYVDMDDVLCNFAGGARKRSQADPNRKFPQSKIGFFENLEPIEDGIESVQSLLEDFDVYILTAPSTRNPHSYMEKRIWIEKYFGYEFTSKLIISPNKGLSIGDYLIDDNVRGKGQENFKGELIHFGSATFPDWKSVVQHLRSKENQPR
ncbi:MAG: hypothetical protein AB8B55_00575 [Mariniblastus sp.]